MITRYLRKARILRTWGVLAGLFLPPLLAVALGGIWGRSNLSWGFVGYLVGAIYAEVSLVRPAPAGARSATLMPRELAQYLPGRLLWAQRGLGALAAATGVAALVLRVGGRTGDEPPDAFLLAAVVVGGAVLGVGLERLERWLVQRPQPFVAPPLVAADDAIRAQSVHSVAGGGIAVFLVLCGVAAKALSGSDVRYLRWPMGIFAALSFLVALNVCQHYAYRAWRVRRGPPGRAGAAPA